MTYLRDLRARLCEEIQRIDKALAEMGDEPPLPDKTPAACVEVLRRLARPMNAAQVVEALCDAGHAVKEGAVHTALSRLARAGTLTRTEHGFYQVVRT